MKPCKDRGQCCLSADPLIAEKPKTFKRAKEKEEKCEIDGEQKREEGRTEEEDM